MTTHLACLSLFASTSARRHKVVSWFRILLALMLMAGPGMLLVSRGEVPPPTITQFQSKSDGSVSFSWAATPETVYRVLVSSNLSDGLWTPIDSIMVSGSSGSWQANGQEGATRFYKLTTDAIAIGSVEPSIISTGEVVTVYLIGQGFGSDDVFRLNGPGGPWVLTNRIVVKPTLVSFVAGPGFTPDLPGDYPVEIISGSSGQIISSRTATLTVMGTPGGNANPRRVYEPPQQPPASPQTSARKGYDYYMAKSDMNSAGLSHNPYFKDNQMQGEMPSRREGKKGLNAVNVKQAFTDVEVEAFEKGFPVKWQGPELDACSRLGPGGIGGISGGALAGRTATGGIIPAIVILARSSMNGSMNGPVSGGERHLRDKVEAVLFSGEVQDRVVDLVIPGRGLDFVWARTYRSQKVARPGFTYQWTCSYDVAVAQTSGGMEVFDGTGRSDVYSLGTNGVYSQNDFFNEGRLSNSVFTLTFPDTGRWIFKPLDGTATAGKLEQIVDRNGNTISLGYDGAGRLAQIVDDLGRTNTVTYGSTGQMSGITDFAGRTVTYEYYGAGDTNGTPGDLKSVISPPIIGTPNGNDFTGGKTNTYTYSAGFANDQENHLLLSVRNGNVEIVYKHVYQHNQTDLEFLRCISAQEGTNDPVYFTHVPQAASPTNAYATIKVTMRDSVGNVCEAMYDSRNRPVNLREYTGRAPKPGAVTETLNRPTGKLRSSDPDYYETKWVWNNDSLCAREIEPGGNSVSCAYESDLDRNAAVGKKGDLRVCRELPCCADVDGDGFSELTTRLSYDPRFGSPPMECRLIGAYLSKKGYDYYQASSGRRTKPIRDWIKPAFDKSAASRGIAARAGEYVGASERGGIMTKGDDVGICLGADFCVSVTDPNGNTAGGSYDENGNLKSWEPHKMPGLDSPEQEFAYSGQGQLLWVTNLPDANGLRRVDARTYYTNGTMAGYLRDFTVDAQGPTVLVTTFEYDARGNVTRCIDPRTNDWLFTYNAMDQLVQCESATLGGSGASFRIATQYTYDANDNLVQVDTENRDQNGTLDTTNPQWTTRCAYDQIKRRVQVDRERRSGGFFVTTQYDYDGNGNLVVCRSGEAVNGHKTNSVVQFLYDERDLPFRCVCAPGTTVQSTTEYGYDANGKLAALNSGLESSIQSVTTRVYNGFSRLSQVTDPMGNQVTNRYDANGNLTECTVLGQTNDVAGSADNQVLARTVYQYDARNREVQCACTHLRSSGAPVGDGAATTTFAYAPNNECISVMDDNGHTTTFGYDTAGRVISETSPGGKTIRLQYRDQAGNPTAMTQTDISDLGGPAQVFSRTNSYDALNRCVSTTDNVGNTETCAYDSRGNMVQHIDARGTLSGMTYDGLNRCIATVTDLNGDGLLDFAADAGSLTDYDDNDCVLSVTDANSNSRFFTYDDLNRRVQTTCADGSRSSLVWSPRSNLISETDPNGTAISYSYDQNDRCTRKDVILSVGSPVSATTTFETFAYDGCGRLTLASNDVSRLTFDYDTLGNCTTSTQDGLSTTCVFDGEGNCLSMTYPGGRVVTYTYDALDQTASVSTGGSLAASYAYDGPGRLASVTRGNGVATRIQWDGAQGAAGAQGDQGWRQVVGISHTVTSQGAQRALDQRRMAYDANQNKTLRRQVTEFVAGQGLLTNVWSYNPLDMMDHAIHSRCMTCSLLLTDYEFDAVGNRLMVTNNGVAHGYTRESTIPPGDFQMDQYTTTPFGNQQYDENGNEGQAGSATGQTLYTYDYANRMVAAQVTDFSTGVAVTTQVNFTYDALGNRLTKSVGTNAMTPPITTYFVRACKSTEVCGNGIIEERAGGPGGGVIHADCLSGKFGAIAGMHRNECLARFSGAGPLEYYPLCDDLGNTLALTDAGGNVLERYEYEDFGAPHFLSSDGVDTGASSSAYGNEFLFSGMEWDPESGLYAEARYSTDPYVEDCQRSYDPKTGQYLSRYTMFLPDGKPCRATTSLRAYGGNNPWTPHASAGSRDKSKGKTKGDFNLATRFSVEIDGVVVGGKKSSAHAVEKLEISWETMELK